MVLISSSAESSPSKPHSLSMSSLTAEDEDCVREALGKQLFSMQLVPLAEPQVCCHHAGSAPTATAP
jgi:hypothetical protein